MKKEKNIVFVVELLLLFLLLAVVIVVITGTFAATRSQSLRAGHITDAVILAESVAETASGAHDMDEAGALIGRMENVRNVMRVYDTVDAEDAAAGGSAAADDRSAGTISLEMDISDEDGTVRTYQLVLVRSVEDGLSGSLSRDVIEVYYGADTEPVYTLQSENYLREAAA